MIGVVFCGGKSTRMGTDKGLIPILDDNWASLAFKKLSNLGIPVKVSINSDQKLNYLNFFAEEQLLPDNLSLHVAGPLLGLLTAHVQYPNESIFVLACDLPLMEVGLLKRLQLAEENEPETDAIVYLNSGNVEPLCAAYKPTGLVKVMSELRSNTLRRHSMKHVLSLLKVHQLDIPKGEEQSFTNFNTQGIT
ncbi:NTP transferase domain-containing protein [Pedobacter petrophilus]|uniref:NTP transferase domain-containing protein n=1 Tax=Pedobacter petrophilus TaxID=1908241 RepID=A0A7K0G4E2_9SPHI|nr:molybdenum cofactor guanylyltransferase [Pedobacter petrophilus]MRX78678.1 NTP transferase domain-containing protein [Pedobacter petrophilus]